MKKDSQTCYACDEPATSVEHVPQKCLFIEDKDLAPGMESQRRNLITVPSCSEHNHDMSAADEEAFTLILLGHCCDENEVAIRQLNTKGRRMYERGSPTFRQLFERIGPAENPITGPGGARFPIPRQIVERFIGVMRKIAQGLFFKINGFRWTESLTVVVKNFAALEKDILALWQIFHNLNSAHGWTEPTLCENQDVFTFKYLLDERPQDMSLSMSFYRNFEVFVSSGVDETLDKHRNGLV